MSFFKCESTAKMSKSWKVCDLDRDRVQECHLLTSFQVGLDSDHGG